MSIVQQIGLVRSSGVTEQVFTSLLGGDFRTVEYGAPHEYVQKYWDAYQASGRSSASVNGKLFELIIETLLYREGILPYYIQAKATFVPNAVFDVLLYTEGKPVSLSIKTSLRERYKQADLEATALKYVHRNAQCFLLSLEKNEAGNVAEKIKNSDVLGLDGVIYCISDELDDLMARLKQLPLRESKVVEVVTGQVIKQI